VSGGSVATAALPSAVKADGQGALGSLFLGFARTEGLTKRAQVRKALDEHERRATVVAALLKDDPKLWERYLGPSERTSREK
jgi:hypothetical protein